MGTTRRYCPDCGSRLVYYGNLSNPKAPNEHRILTYGCMSCTKDTEKPKLISIERNKVEDPIEAVRVRITEKTESE